MGNPEALQVSPTNTEENCFDQIVSGHHADPAGHGATENNGARGVPEPGTAHSPSKPGTSSPRSGRQQLSSTAGPGTRPGRERPDLQPVDGSDDGTDEGRQPRPAARGEVRQSAGAARQHGLRGQAGQHPG